MILLLPKPMTYIVSVSGGLGSAEALKRTLEQHGRGHTVALFADVKGSGRTHTWNMPAIDDLLHERYGGEARDLYRFLWQLSYYFDLPIERLTDGRSIWRIFAENRAFRLWSGGGFVHKCSEILKRQQIKQYVLNHFAPGTYSLVLGMGYDEGHRVKTAQAYWRRELGWEVEVLAPNAEPPYAVNCDTQRWCQAAGIEVSQSYYDGFQHDNCGGGCIAAGQAHFANLYKTRREMYLYWAYMEASIQRLIGKSVTILKVERGGETKPLSLYAFVPRIEAGDYPKLDWGGCGCFTGQLSLFKERAA